jgi:aryl-alcohol dehydrogenase-like predicted oxidoreductase
MKKNKLGRTNLEVSQITLGGGWVGGLFIDAEYKVMERAIELALASGINWIDTAESYSEGVSEKNIGSLLACLKKEEKLYVSSKARLDPQSSETFESQIDRKLDNSLKRLKLDRLNLYQLHNKIKIDKSSECTYRKRNIIYKWCV